MSHPVFGDLQLAYGANGPYWIHETYGPAELSVSIATVEGEPPSETQVAFFRTIVEDQDAAFALISSALSIEYQKMLGRPMPSDWRKAFLLGGVGVPLDGERQNPWDITFECLTDKCGHLYTAYFEGGQLSNIGIDT